MKIKKKVYEIDNDEDGLKQVSNWLHAFKFLDNSNYWKHALLLKIDF